MASLQDLHPRHGLVVSAALLGSAGLLAGGLTLPILHTRQLIFWQETYSVWTGILDLWKLGEHVLAIVVFLFSMVFPIAKLLALTYVWYWRLHEEPRARLLHRLGMLGKWSMMDVFVVAILIVLVKVGSLAKVEPRLGVYLFASAILLSMLTTSYVDRLGRAASWDRGAR
ncbi:MAG TPA: paraquat-inducible protein A [bacterium]